MTLIAEISGSRSGSRKRVGYIIIVPMLVGVGRVNLRYLNNGWLGSFVAGSPGGMLEVGLENQ